MGLLRIAAVGALGYFAYQAWQRRSSAALEIEEDTPSSTDRPLVTNVSDDANRTSYDEATSTPGTSAH
ncbi:hypothetical protein LU699_06630 [Luteimonas fraxinea]|uniref:Uncharacterized protein n=1 Tax=Luteimonas fraxinea TaxID=2901869 RepID=A0ABS8U9H1_9GAMM|nr:hypothetical protein [Luteimonas fraxinea]MCD9095411.1 hypothetical protein [Luteimonas fraxinea]MCD9126348.1 hypothetical protein [Luteimonas fraxinea]UHH11380.1 hypothetical protein LU699_06630 [Luteimonas fraxinea]